MDEIFKWSDPARVRENADEYLGYNVPLYLSAMKNKKYMVKNPDGQWVHFGQIGYEDFTKHQDEGIRISYLKRATKIKGVWTDDAYSPNSLAINLLWN
jgi:hypothetical protein